MPERPHISVVCFAHNREASPEATHVNLLVKKGRPSFCLWSVQSPLRISSWLAAVTSAGALMLELADGSALTEISGRGFGAGRAWHAGCFGRWRRSARLIECIVYVNMHILHCRGSGVWCGIS